MVTENRNAKELSVSRTQLFLIVSAGLACFVAIWFYAGADTIGKRNRTLKKLEYLQQRILANPNDRVALEKLIAALDDSNRFTRSCAASTLGQIGTMATNAVPVLARMVERNDDFVSREAALSLKNLGILARESIPSLVKALKFGNCDTAWFAAEALGNMAPVSRVAIPPLAECLQADDQMNQTEASMLAREAATALAKFGTNATEVLPTLRRGLESKDGYYRVKVAFAIRAIDSKDEESLRVIIEGVKSNQSHVQSEALTSLGKLGTNAQTAVPAIEAYLKQTLEEEDRDQAQDVLRRVTATSPQKK